MSMSVSRYTREVDGLRLINDVIHGSPLPGMPVVAGQIEAMPIGTELRMIAPVVISRPGLVNSATYMINFAVPGRTSIARGFWRG